MSRDTRHYEHRYHEAGHLGSVTPGTHMAATILAAVALIAGFCFFAWYLIASQAAG